MEKSLKSRIRSTPLMKGLLRKRKSRKEAEGMKEEAEFYLQRIQDEESPNEFSIFLFFASCNLLNVSAQVTRNYDFKDTLAKFREEFDGNDVLELGRNKNKIMVRCFGNLIICFRRLRNMSKEKFQGLTQVHWRNSLSEDYAKELFEMAKDFHESAKIDWKRLDEIVKFTSQ